MGRLWLIGRNRKVLAAREVLQLRNDGFRLVESTE